jgi:hypothetical protein
MEEVLVMVLVLVASELGKVLVALSLCSKVLGALVLVLVASVSALVLVALALGLVLGTVLEA